MAWAQDALDRGDTLDPDDLLTTADMDHAHYLATKRAGIHPLQGLPAITRNQAHMAADLLASDLDAAL